MSRPELLINSFRKAYNLKRNPDKVNILRRALDDVNQLPEIDNNLVVE